MCAADGSVKTVWFKLDLDLFASKKKKSLRTAQRRMEKERFGSVHYNVVLPENCNNTFCWLKGKMGTLGLQGVA